MIPIIVAALAALAIVKQRRSVLRAGISSDAAVPMPTNPHVDNQVTTAAAGSAYAAANATGNPSVPASSRPGRGFTPGRTTQFLRGPGIISGPAPVNRVKWSAPSGGRGPDQKASWPGGSFPGPSGPTPPANGSRAYAQSAVSSPSPYLPEDLDLITPLAANPWFYNLSGVDPLLAAAAGSGGYIMTERVDPMRAIASAIGKR